MANLRGEVGASNVKKREIKSKLNFAKYLLNADNDLVREVFRTMIEDRKYGKWMKVMTEYKDLLGVTFEQLGRMEDREIKKKVDEYGLREWRRELEEKSTLGIYRIYKEKIGSEDIYENSYNSVILYRARTNTLMLGWRNRFEGGQISCGMCGAADETLEHFLVECEGLREVWDRYRDFVGIKEMLGRGIG